MKINVSGCMFYVSEQVMERQFPEFLRVVCANKRIFARNVHCFMFIHHYLQGYDFSYAHLYDMVEKSGIGEYTFCSMLLQDCRYYRIDSLAEHLYEILIDIYPDLVPSDMINTIVNQSQDRMDEILLLSSQKTQLLTQIDTDSEEGLLDLSDADKSRVEQIRLRDPVVPYLELQADIDSLKEITGKRVRQKMEGVVPQILIWVTGMIYKMLGLEIDSDGIRNRVKTVMRNHKSTIGEFYESMGQLGWHRVEAAVDYSAMICTDAATK